MRGLFGRRAGIGGAVALFLFLFMGLAGHGGWAEAAPVRGQGAPQDPLNPRATVFRGGGWLGVAMERGGAEGVRITHVVRGSPAEKGKLRENDRIVRLGGGKVESASAFTRAVSAMSPGDTAAIVVVREGQETTVNVVLGERPSGDELMRMDYVGSVAPPVSGLVRVAGAGPTQLAALRGRVVLLDFWATWCGPCRYTLPILNDWQNRYGAQGLSILGVTTDDAAVASRFAEQNGMRYTVHSDSQGETSRTYNVTALPTMFIIDKRGVVRQVITGYEPGGEQRIEALLRGLLAEPAP